MYEQLNVTDILPALHGYAALIAGTNRVWRLEFNTLGAGRYLGLLADLRTKSASHLASEQGSLRLISDNRDGRRRMHLQ
jgi:hypothetical protein